MSFSLWPNLNDCLVYIWWTAGLTEGSRKIPSYSLSISKVAKLRQSNNNSSFVVENVLFSLPKYICALSFKEDHFSDFLTCRLISKKKKGSLMIKLFHFFSQMGRFFTRSPCLSYLMKWSLFYTCIALLFFTVGPWAGQKIYPEKVSYYIYQHST